MNRYLPGRFLRPHAACSYSRTSALFALLLGASLLRGEAVLAQTQPSAPLPAASPSTAPQSTASNMPIIGKITVTGTHNLPAAFVLSASGHKAGDPCTPETLAEMQKKLVGTCYFGGHSKHEEDVVRVTAVTDTKGVCKVTITVDENQQMTGISLSGTGPIKPDQVLPLLHLKPGEVYNDKQLLLDALAIQNFYQQKGYVANLGEASISKKGVLDMQVMVARVAEISIVGDKSIDQEQIRKAMKTKVGDYFHTPTVAEDQNRLKELPTLKSRKFSIADAGVGKGRVKLIITVEDPTPK